MPTGVAREEDPFDRRISERLWAYEREIVARRWHLMFAVGAAVLMPFWIIFDYLFAGDVWQVFGLLRIGVTCLMVGSAYLAYRLDLHSLFLGYLVSIVLHGSIVSMLPFTGEHLWVYSLGFAAAFIGSGMLLFWRLVHSVVVIVIILAIYAFFFFQFSDLGVAEVIGTGGALVFTVAIISTIFTSMRVKLGEREFQTRLQLYQTQESLHRSSRRLSDAHAELEKRNEALDLELDIAAEIQSGILPPETITVSNTTMHSFYAPLGKVGGDFYDILPMEQSKRVAVLVADVSGHGIPAALITAMAKIAFSSATRIYSNPMQILNHMNTVTNHTIKTQDYLSAFCVVIDADDRRFRMANAGHQPGLLLRRQKDVIEIRDPDGLPLGVEDDYTTHAEESASVFEPGDRLFLYTDGIVEAENDDGTPFTESRLRDAIMRHASESPELQLKKVILDWNDFATAPRRDDATLLLIDLK